MAYISWTIKKYWILLCSEKETLAIVSEYEKGCVFVYGRIILAATDLLCLQKSPGKLFESTKLFFQILMHDLQTEYRLGRDLMDAETLFRAFDKNTLEQATV